MKKRYMLNVIAAGVLAMGAADAMATTITAHMTADNSFNVYLSVSPFSAGTAFGSGGNPSTAYTFSPGWLTLTPGVTNYLHVEAVNGGSIGAFIGDFSLSDAGFEFANSTQSLMTNPTQWTKSYTGWGGEPLLITTDAIAVPSGIAAGAQWLDFTDAPFAGPTATAWFSAAITPVVPEPAFLSIFGLAGLLLKRSRRD